MAKTNRYTNFREFYEDETRPKKLKPIVESKKKKDKFRKQFNNVDPNELDEEDFDEFDEYVK
jgi:hypothetical protein